MSTNDPVSPSAFLEADGAEDWRILGDGACVFYRTGSFADAARLVAAIAALPDVDDHPPAVDLRHDGVTIRVVTVRQDLMGMTEGDLAMAREISAVARELGLAADPAGLQSLLVIPGAPDVGAILPFWRAVLGYEPRPDSPDEDLVDPNDRNAAFWFEQMEQSRPGGGGAIHLAVWVPHEEAESRVAAALAAGGRMVREEDAPSFWTLADPAGNEADVATISGRD